MINPSDKPPTSEPKMSITEALVAAHTVGEAVDGLLELAAELAANAGVTLEEWIEYSAHAFARIQGDQITDCKIELTLEERPPAN